MSEDVEPVEINDSGVTIEKSFRPEDEGGFPMVVYKITSSRDTNIAIRIVDELPEVLEFDSIGFHPQHGAEQWSGDDEQVVYTNTVGAGEDILTVYGVKDFEAYDITAGDLVDEPEVNITDVDADTTITEPNEGDEGHEVSADDLDNLPFDENEGSGRVGEAEVPADGEDEVEVPGQPDDPPVTGDTTTATNPTPTSDSNESVGGNTVPTKNQGMESKRDSVNESFYRQDSLAAELATELKQGTLDRETREVFANEVERILAETTQGESSSLDVRVRYLQQRVSALNAYIDALEEFIDESGTAEELIRTTKDQLNEFRTRVDEAEEKLQAAQTERNELYTSLTDAESEIDTIHSEIESLQTGLEGANEDIDTLQDGLEDAESDIERLDEDIEEVSESADGAHDRLDDAESDIETVEEDVSELEDEFENVEAKARRAQGEVADLQEEVAEQRSQVNENTEKVEGVREDLEADEKRIDFYVDKIEDVEDGVEELDDAVGDLTEEIDAIAGATDDIDALAEELTGLEDEVDDISENLEELADAAGDQDELAERIDELENEVDEIDPTEDIAEAEEVQRLDQRMDTLENTLNSLSEDVKRIDKFVNTLSSAIGGVKDGE